MSDIDFIPFVESVDLKELKFDVKCIKGFYGKEELYTVVTTPVDFNNKKSLEPLISCPIYQQAFRWIRDNHKLWQYITPYEDFDDVIRYSYSIITSGNEEETQDEHEGYASYEEAELLCLREMIEMIKKVKDEKNNNTR